MDFTRIEVTTADGVATVVLDRPEVHNAFDHQMIDEISSLWRALRHDDDVRAVVLTGRGDRAFCTGIDRADAGDYSYDPLTYEDPGKALGPKTQELWKPVVAAVNGMACGGAFYFLGEADIIVAARHATFFDPHVTYGMVAAYEPLLLMARMPFGEVVRMTLMGAHERMSAERAMQAGLVSEVVEAEELLEVAGGIAGAIASQPATVVQSTLRTLWAARDLSAAQSTSLGNVFLQLGATQSAMLEGQAMFDSGTRITPRVR